MFTKMSGEELFVAETILQGEQDCVLFEQRRNQVQQHLIGSGFDGDDDKIAGANLCRATMAGDISEVHVAQGTSFPCWANRFP